MSFGKFNPLQWFRRAGGDQPKREPDGARESSTPAPAQANAWVKSYSRRMMPPFTGQLQFAETGDARALSIDGKHWEIQYRYAGKADGTPLKQGDSARQRDKYTAVASIGAEGLQRHSLHPYFDTEAVSLAIDRLDAWIAQSSLPYPALDRYEYWLLDRAERKPLALLHSCVSEAEIGTSAVRPTWMAMPAAQLRIEDATEDPADYVPPVNARLESMIAERAGPSPRAAWYDRSETADVDFPPCLIDENWEQEEHRRLCQLYIRRLAPRLLMLQGLENEDRRRLEQASRENALDVERFHPLYPEVIDRKMLTALRVEARLRGGAGPASS